MKERKLKRTREKGMGITRKEEKERKMKRKDERKRE